ncbi:hypothetical protein [Mesorhizobium sp. Mes31]|uniref:hypothetical protein n=1 Tax=Mesorhizobium sp. Mes31 TaxID=2926017 RepID=UPI0021184DC9|nr:hypothetical protein [Mesorhizobium sp. Mes31]
MAKADNERVNFAWQYGAQARKDGKERVVPQVWAEFADAWLKGFDGGNVAAAAGKPKPVSDTLEAELDEPGVSDPSQP